MNKLFKPGFLLLFIIAFLFSQPLYADVTHSKTLTGLLPGHTYHYRVKTKNAAGAEYISGDYTFTTNAAAQPGPALTGFSTTNITSSSATLNWTCNAPCTGYYDIGTTNSYGTTNSPGQNDLTYSAHAQSVSNLAPNTLYHWRAHSTNFASVETISADQTFTTSSSGVVSPTNPPTLVNAVNPMTYGAKCDGITNDSAAFQTAVNVSDVLVPANKTCVINAAVNIAVNNRHIQCGANTILKQNVTGPIVFDIREAVAGQRLTGVSIANCYFLGTNTSPPTTDWNNPAKHWNIPIQTRDRVDNVTIVGNTFDRFYGQAMFETYGVLDGGHGDQIVYNTFKNCGYYGPVFVAHTNGYIGHNTAIDCAIGIENDVVTPPQLTGGNIIENNTITCIYGYGSLDMEACAMLTGGASYDQDYTTNIVRNNSISGVANAQGAHPGYTSRIIIGTRWGPRIHPAQYINNSCTGGCNVIP
jgi:hypothetical protein